eukprot:214460-Rhodomonas_salina.1
MQAGQLCVDLASVKEALEEEDEGLGGAAGEGGEFDPTVSAVQCANDVQCAKCNVQCAMCNVRFARCNVQGAVCSVRSPMRGAERQRVCCCMGSVRCCAAACAVGGAALRQRTLAGRALR